MYSFCYPFAKECGALSIFHSRAVLDAGQKGNTIASMLAQAVGFYEQLPLLCVAREGGMLFIIKAGG
ncbi:hypothetical protein D6779_04080 [Candidatus Parcubacteria bacterium]|nr:MAG: hypothetical protein D6779_04080 [Candidatus Parcubacteria bacterium]